MQSFIQGILVPLEGAFFKNGICDSFVENFKDSDFCQEKNPHTQTIYCQSSAKLLLPLCI